MGQMPNSLFTTVHDVNSCGIVINPSVMIMILNVAVVVTLVLARGCDAQSVRTWKFNTNFNSTENWDRHEVPCKTSTVIFPTDMQIPVLLPTANCGNQLPASYQFYRNQNNGRPCRCANEKNPTDADVPQTSRTVLLTFRGKSLGISVLEIGKLVLSRQGWLIFPRTDGVVSLSAEERHASCSGGNFKFIRNGSKKWADPESWLSPSEFSNKATPHFERIPCKFDAVTFPDDSTFSIALPSRPISVSKVKIQGQEIKTQSEWSEFLYAYGYEFFPGLLQRGLDSFQISGETCRDASGCECGNAHLSEDICSEKLKLPELQCADPVQPIGFCHPICGAYLLLKEGSSRDIRSETETFLKSGEIISHTSKANGFVQIVLVDKYEYTGNIKDFAKQLHQHLRDKGLVKDTSSTMVSFSGLRTKKIETRDVMGRFLLALLFSVLGFGMIFCTYEKNWLTRSLDWERLTTLWSGASSESWGFARFENTSGTVEISEEAKALNLAASKKSKDGKLGFDNPMFSGGQQSSDGVVMREFEGRRGCLNTIDTDSGSLAESDSTSHDELSMKEVNLEALNQ